MADMRTQPETPFKAASRLSAEERRKREDAVRFYNPTRRHSTLRYVSPAQFEATGKA
jgi:transposase InsO family protein